MPGEKGIWVESFKAADDLSAYQNCFVKLSAANTVDVCGLGEKMIGVLKNAPKVAGAAAEVQILGMAELKVSNNPNVTIGAWMKSGALGVGVLTTTDKDVVGGQANGTATVDAVLVEILLLGPKTIKTA